MSYSIVRLADLMIEKKIGKFRIDSNPQKTKFGCTVDYNPTYYGSTIEQACSKAIAALEKKWAMKSAISSYGEKLIKETGTEGLF